ncbi:MAG: type IX secretion system protein PorQ [Bacteroidia bacterium]|nr:type IX secretion system protein PorQ [Bacteroidia bacterium]
MVKYLYINIFWIWTLTLNAQIGGSEVFQFLDLSNSARITALGEHTLAMYGDDATGAYLNPSILNNSMDGSLSFNHNFRFEGIGNGYVSFAKHLSKIDYTAHVAVQYIGYGEFEFRDETGQKLNTFDATEQAIVFGVGKQWNRRWGFGVNAKFVNSRFETYKATGLFFDVAGIYRDSSGSFVATLVLGNVGTQLSKYTQGNLESTPFEIAFGISKRLEKLPVTLYFNLGNLQKWNLDNENPFDEEVIFLGQDPKEKSQLEEGLDNLMRHISLGTEFDIGKRGVFKLRLGYNHLKRKDLSVQNLRSLAGFSFGFGVKVKKFQIDYGNMIYHLAGSSNHFSISTNLNSFKKVF